MSSTPEPIPSESQEKLFFGGLAGLAVAMVLSLIDKREALNGPFSCLHAGLDCVALALPMLVASFLLEINKPPRQLRSTRRALFDLTGIFLAVTGFVLVFFFLNVTAGSLLLLASVGCAGVVVFAMRSSR